MTDIQAVFHTLVEKHYPFGGVVAVKGTPNNPVKKQSALASLINHRKICNHPIFVSGADGLTGEPQYKAAIKGITESYECSGKMLGLVELLTQCEILS
jgi:hypothetical protein